MFISGQQHLWIQDDPSSFLSAVEMLTIALIHLRTFLQEEIHHGRMAKASLRKPGVATLLAGSIPAIWGHKATLKKSGMFFLKCSPHFMDV